MPTCVAVSTSSSSSKRRSRWDASLLQDKASFLEVADSLLEIKASPLEDHERLFAGDASLVDDDGAPASARATVAFAGAPFSKSVALPVQSKPLRPESRTLFVEPDGRVRHGTARSRKTAERSEARLAALTYLFGKGAISSDGGRTSFRIALAAGQVSWKVGVFRSKPSEAGGGIATGSAERHRPSTRRLS